jgi:hypothetical protein
MSETDKLDDLKALNTCDENKDILKYHFHQNKTLFSASISDGVDLTYLMLYIINKHKQLQKLDKS